MRKALALILFLLTNWVQAVIAQSECTVTHYDEFSGMAQWYVTQIVQDQQGMMWFATWNGLNRFDGYEFECFKSQAGDGVDVPSDRISNMIMADDGSLRCYVEGRVFGFCTKSCKWFTISETEEKRLKQVFETTPQGEASMASDVWFDYKDIYGTEWRISEHGRLMRKNSSSGIYEDYPANWHGASRVLFCKADREGNAWLVSNYGVFKLSFYRKPYKFLEQESHAQVRSAFVDNKLRYWVATKDDAAIRIYDRQNHLMGYLGIDGRLHPQYKSFGSPIYHIFQDSKGTFWLSSKPGGLFRLKETAEKTFSVEHFIHHAEDKSSLSGNELYYTAEDRHGRLWIASFNTGIDCIPDPQAKTPVFLHMEGEAKTMVYSKMRVRQLLITRQNILLVASSAGLLVADVSPKDTRQIVFKQHTKDPHRSNSLSNNATMYITEDEKGRIFVCTESGGVNQILTDDLLADELEFRHFNTSTGLPSDVALSAVPFNHRLLVVSNNQLIWLNADTEDRSDYRAFFWKDKLRFSDATPIMLPDGRGLFGLQDGAFFIRKEDIGRSNYVPPIALTELLIENQYKNRAVNDLDTLVLDPSQRDFRLCFAALNYSDAAQIEYAFRLGEESPWNNIGKDRSATFLDMKPGVYQLQIRSTDADGLWADNIRTLTIIVKPTFWETRWAQLLYVLLLGAIVYTLLYIRRYIRNLNRRQKELHEAYLTLLNANQDHPESKMIVEQPPKPQVKPEDEAFMQRAIHFIEEHLGDSDINIGDMATATATSRSGLNRKMKSLLGVTPLDFIREARIRKACQLLKQGTAVNDVAYSCGFSDPKYFGKCFKAEMGMTPTEYKVENSPS